MQIIFDCKLHKLILETNKMAQAAKQDVHCWKEITCIFINFCFQKKESSLTGIIQWSFRCKVSCFPRPSLFMACSKRHNLCMNRASLDHESLDRVPWNRSTPAKLNKANAMLSKIRHYIDQKTLKAIYHAIFESPLYSSSLVWAQNVNSTMTVYRRKKKRFKTYVFLKKRCTYIVTRSSRIVISLNSMEGLHLRTLFLYIILQTWTSPTILINSLDFPQFSYSQHKVV